MIQLQSAQDRFFILLSMLLNIFVTLFLQYMSAVFYHNEEQKRLAEETLKDAQKKNVKAIQTKILPASTFYDAEEYNFITNFWVTIQLNDIG